MAEITNHFPVDLADLESRKEDDGQIMEVRHPGTNEVLRHDDGRPYTITLVGRESDRYVQLERQIGDRRLQATMRTRQPTLMQMTERDQVDLLVNATLTWDLKFGDEKTSEPKPQNYRDAYTKARWLRRQVDEFVGNTGNFFKAT